MFFYCREGQAVTVHRHVHVHDVHDVYTLHCIYRAIGWWWRGTLHNTILLYIMYN